MTSWNTSFDILPNIFEKFVSIHRAHMNISDLSFNPLISLDYIMNNRQMGWVWHKVMERNDLTSDVILKHPDIAWWFNSKIPINILELNPDLSWDPYNLGNEYIPIDMVAKHPDLNWNWYCLTTHLDLTLDIIHYIENIANKNWFWSSMSERTDFIENEWKCYKRIKEWQIKLSIFSNETLPIYLMLDILHDEYPYKTDYELYTIILS